MSTQPLYSESIGVYVAEEGFYFEPQYAAPISSKPTLQVTRPDGRIAVNEPALFALPTHPSYSIFGVLGLIQLLSGPYLIVATGRKLACKFLGNFIWRVSAVDFLPCNPFPHLLTDQARTDEEHLISMMKSFLASDQIYYSPTLDLTQSLQSRHTREPGSGFFPFADLRFVMNRSVATPFVDILQAEPECRLQHFMLFCIEGYVNAESLLINQRRITFGLISRRASARSGCRFHSRGIDQEGNVSNFVESEQILVVDENLCSFVQIRGSIPLFWRQNINMRYRPPMELYNHSQADGPFEKHFGALAQNYGLVTAVNLVNTHGWEGELSHLFTEKHQQLARPDLKYLVFDFNQHCSRMQWHRVSMLLDQIEGDLDSHGYFRGALDRSSGSETLAFSRVYQKQLGVVRTNCIDCLDRTNVVQSSIARNVLAQQLRLFNLLQEKEPLQKRAPLEALLKEFWADNGDTLSLQYSGTGALKVDYTRTGKRTKMGLVRDGLNSLMRYYLNNFTDGVRQDAMDLFHGHYSVQSENYYSPFVQRFDRALLAAPAIALLSLACVMYYLLFSQASPSTRATSALIFTASLVFAMHWVFRNGLHYVQYPRLCPPPAALQSRPRIKAVDPRQYQSHVRDPARKVHNI